MNKNDYLDKKIPEGSGEPDNWNYPQYQRDTKEMHRLDEEWQKVLKKTKEYLRVLGGKK